MNDLWRKVNDLLSPKRHSNELCQPPLAIELCMEKKKGAVYPLLPLPVWRTGDGIITILLEPFIIEHS
ncbi:MAG: hypothetical protein BZY87_02035 [SAR202 cluster bacterium Io17-Chloro-G6]|nr:MAG: hypothetical protein BZY87_02035 [SAR202 cluster bacterium Io17-Chloro-G6]